MKKWTTFSLFFCFVLLVVCFFGNNEISALTIPTGPPPEDNMPTYLNIGGEDQVKRGALRLGTDDIDSTYYYQLEVLGEGAEMSNVVAEENLKVRQTVATSCSDDGDCTGDKYCSYGFCRKDLLFIDSENHKVCIGSCLGVEGSKVEVSDQMSVESDAVESGSLEAYSDVEALYGVGDSSGVQGVSLGADNIGVSANSAIGTALEGVNTTNSYSAVFGSSDKGYGIYGTNENFYGLWAGYFIGRVQSNQDVSGAKFSATQLQSSLVPYTVGQEVGSLPYTNAEMKYFDGTYLWFNRAGYNDLYKVRVSDGFQIFKKELAPGIDGPITEIIFDGSYIWTTVAGNVDKVFKIDPYTGDSACEIEVKNPQSIAYDGQYYWVTYNFENRGRLAKINNLCQQVVVKPPVGAEPAETTIVLSNEENSIGKIIFDGSYLWTIAIVENLIFTINPSSGEAAGWLGLVGNNPKDIFFDNYFYWVVNREDNNVTKYYLADYKICSGDQTFVCSYDSDCEAEGLGACFAWPEKFSSYPVGIKPSSLAYDGTYLWTSNVGNSGQGDQSLTRLLAADPSQRTDYSLSFVPYEILYDGTYLWVPSNGTVVKKLYTGTGMDSTDLSDTLALQFNNPLEQQEGSININSAGRIGENMTADGELEVGANVWGEQTLQDVIVSDEWEATSVFPGDENGTVLSLLYTSSGYLLAGDKYNCHVYRSSDRGDTWEDIGGLGEASCWIWGIIEAQDGTLYASRGDEVGNGGKVWTSTDNGASWQETTTRIPTSSDHAYECIEGSDSWIYCGAYDDYVYKTNDRGDSWVTSAAIPGPEGSISALLSASDGYIYAASKWYDKIFRTNDGGVSWETRTDVPGVSGIYDLIEGSDGAIYAATGASGANVEGYIYKTIDGGATWIEVADLTGDNIGDVYVLYEADGVYYAGTHEEAAGPTHIGHIYHSIDGGNTWVEMSQIAGIMGAESLTSGPDGTVYAGTGNLDRVYRTSEPLGMGTYSCPEGHFVKNIETNNEGKVTRIECAPL